MVDLGKERPIPQLDDEGAIRLICQMGEETYTLVGQGDLFFGWMKRSGDISILTTNLVIGVRIMYMTPI